MHKKYSSEVNKQVLKVLIDKYAYDASDSDELRLNKSLILIISVCLSLYGLIWGGVCYTYQGLGTTAIPLIYAVIVIPSVFISHYMRNYKLLVYINILSISLVASLIQWSLGSVYDSGFVLVWCFLSLFGAALFLNKKQIKILSLLFFLMIAFVVIVVPILYLNGDKIIKKAHIIISTVNVLIPFLIVFITTYYFLNEIKKQKKKVSSLLISESVDKEMCQFFTTVNTPIFGVDPEGIINEWNEATEKITGYKQKEVLGSHWLKYTPKNSQIEAKKVVSNALIGKETANYEFNSISKDGQDLILLLNINTRRNIRGEIVGVLAVGQDITELYSYRNELELKVNQRTLKLNEALKKQKELNELKSKFVSTASHEFRTPLSAINFAAGSIKNYWTKMDPIMVEKKLNRIENQVLFMTDLLDDILMVGQGEAAEITNTPVPINLGKFMTEIIEEVYHSYERSHQIDLIDPEKLKNSTIFMDEKLARNIFINLTSNAIKFSPKAKRVTIELSSEKNQTVISVTDFGIGIPKNELKKIFNPFTRGDNVALIKGNGLGLSIVKDAINVLGGEIIVSSSVGKGTTFTVKIPNI